MWPKIRALPKAKRAAPQTTTSAAMKRARDAIRAELKKDNKFRYTAARKLAKQVGVTDMKFRPIWDDLNKELSITRTPGRKPKG